MYAFLEKNNGRIIFTFVLGIGREKNNYLPHLSGFQKIYLIWEEFQRFTFKYMHFLGRQQANELRIRILLHFICCSLSSGNN